MRWKKAPVAPSEDRRDELCKIREVVRDRVSKEQRDGSSRMREGRRDGFSRIHSGRSERRILSIVEAKNMQMTGENGRNDECE